MGYSDNLELVAKVTDFVVRAGTVGINVEDGAGSTDLILQKNRSGKESGKQPRGRPEPTCISNVW